MKQFKVTNLSQGRLEIKELKKVLDGGAWTIVSEPLPDSILQRMAGDSNRLFDVTEIVPYPANMAAPAPAAPAPNA